MKTIEEIMGLVEKYGWAVVALNDAKSNSDIAKELAKVNESSYVIESALRELVERKPLSEDRIETLFKSTELECLTSAIEFARLIEADHKIGA